MDKTRLQKSGITVAELMREAIPAQESSDVMGMRFEDMLTYLIFIGGPILATIVLVWFWRKSVKGLAEALNQKLYGDAVKFGLQLGVVLVAAYWLVQLVKSVHW